MKSLLFILFIGYFPLQSQAISNSRIVDRDLIWQKIYEIKQSEKQILDLLHISGVFEEGSSIENGFRGRIYNLNPNYENLEIPHLQVPGYISNKA